MTINRTRSHELFARARQLMPGGVNSPARAFGAVGGEPIVFERGTGPYLYERPDTPSFLIARSTPCGLTGYASGSVLWLNPGGSTDVLCGLPKAPDVGKIKDHRALVKDQQSWVKSAAWRYKCAGNAAVIGAPNAILAAIGRPLDKRRPDVDPGGYRIVALNPGDGRVLWEQPLPAEPVRWGLAADSRGRIIVTLRGGRILCFGKERG